LRRRRRGNNRNLKRSHAGRKQNKLEQVSITLAVKSKDQLILALPTPSSLFWYLGKIGGGYCQWCCTSLTQVHKFCSDQFVTHHCSSSCSFTLLFCFSLGVDLVLVMTWSCFSHVVDRPHRRHNHGCHCSGCNLSLPRRPRGWCWHCSSSPCPLPLRV